MNDQRKNLIAAAPCRCAPAWRGSVRGRRGSTGFEVAWIGGEVERDDFTVGRAIFAGCADVILHITTTHVCCVDRRLQTW